MTEEIQQITLRNHKGTSADITNVCASVMATNNIPDKNGKFDDVTLGFTDLKRYLNDNSPYMGSIVGRYGNRLHVIS